MFDVKQKVNEFKTKYRSKCFALADWKNLKMKDFSINEMLECICNAANGSIQEMVNIVDHLTAKKKVMGRTQVYNGENLGDIDIRRNEDGVLELRGYHADAPLPLKGQHQKHNPKIFRKTDDQVNKNFQKAEERMMNLGKKVRELFPGQDKQYITFAMDAIRKYAEQKKIHTDKVIKGLEKGRYTLDDEMWRIIPVVKENKKKHTIVVNENDVSRIIDMIEMTEQKFHANMRRFISMLLQDPVNAKVPYIFSQRNLTRSALLSYLLGGKDPILIRDQKISDKDENGEPKTATMIVKFKCPKKNFDRKLEKLYIKMFEKNLPPRKQKEKEVDEATGCCVSGMGGNDVKDGMGGDGADGGAYPSPFGKPISREMPVAVEIGESTTTFNTGDYTYPAPPFIDKESGERHNGVGGSVSINHVKKSK